MSGYGYESIEHLKESCGSQDNNYYLQLIAECIAEENMFTKHADNSERIFSFKFSPDCENESEEVWAKCDEVEEYIKESL